MIVRTRGDDDNDDDDDDDDDGDDMIASLPLRCAVLCDEHLCGGQLSAILGNIILYFVIRHIYIHTYIHTNTHTHTYIHTYIHTSIHTYIHTYMDGSVLRRDSIEDDVINL